jgi:uncharacterized cupredoxin-like copper-binding protein
VRLALQALMFAGAAVALLATGCGDSGPQHATIAMHYSKFEAPEIVVQPGEPITITLRNDDPIEHEWMVGDAAMHERHRTGTEPYHDSVPTEVTVPALSSRETTVTFERPGQYLYICHLPGHEQYGMVGVVTVKG